MIIDFIIRSHLVYVRYLVECSDALNEQFNSVGEHMFTVSMALLVLNQNHSS